MIKRKSDSQKTGGPPPIPRREKPPFLPDAPSGTTAHTPSENVGGNRSILIIDDNPVVLKAFELKLKASGFTIATTTSATDVARAAETSRAELIILDVNFPIDLGPDWSGYTAMQWLRRFPGLSAIPVILVSGEDSAKHKEKALKEGAIAFFQKPVNYQELLDTVLRTLEIRRRELIASAMRSPSTDA